MCRQMHVPMLVNPRRVWHVTCPPFRGTNRGSYLYGAQVDVLPEYFNRAILRVAVIHSLVHQLVDQREVITDSVLIEVVTEVSLSKNRQRNQIHLRGYPEL